jgi:fatty-acyl-CoA synthase
VEGRECRTSEVAAAITAFPGVTEPNVCGVKLLGTDGAAGMTAIVTENELDFARQLPRVHPLALSARRGLETTTTFKHTKADLSRDGYDPTVTSDASISTTPQREGS